MKARRYTARPMNGPLNRLFYGDNLHVLREHVASESVDLIYLDPPFNSARDYNVIFREKSGADSPAQIKAFSDSWSWTETAYHDFQETCYNASLIALMRGFVDTLGRNDLTAYLVMMSARIVELHRVLKPTGSIYLHCDPTASHYLKIVLDAVFGPRNFRNEIVWKRTNVHNDARRKFGDVSDTIFFYSKSDSYFFRRSYTKHSPDYVEGFYKYVDEDGRAFALDNMASPNPRPNMMYDWKGHSYPEKGWRYSLETMRKLDAEGRIWYPKEKTKRPRLKRFLDEMLGTPVGNVWDDIKSLQSQAAERLGYPTQKPLALLERILAASSNDGDVVLDPFCGCGTATVAAQKMGRRWIGIDITHLAISLIKYRLSDAFQLVEKRDFQVIGVPATAAEARALALQDRDSFQQFAIGLVPRAIPAQTKKGADRGIDGLLYFRDDPRTDAKKGMIQVKSGGLGVSYIRDFAHVVNREKATLGLFLSLDEPTVPMRKEAGEFGFYTSPLGERRIPRLQLRTVGDLLEGKPFDVPHGAIFEGIKIAELHKHTPTQGSLGF